MPPTPTNPIRTFFSPIAAPCSAGNGQPVRWTVPPTSGPRADSKSRSSNRPKVASVSPRRTDRRRRSQPSHGDGGTSRRDVPYLGRTPFAPTRAGRLLRRRRLVVDRGQVITQRGDLLGPADQRRHVRPIRRVRLVVVQRGEQVVDARAVAPGQQAAHGSVAVERVAGHALPTEH